MLFLFAQSTLTGILFLITLGAIFFAFVIYYEQTRRGRYYPPDDYPPHYPNYPNYYQPPYPPQYPPMYPPHYQQPQRRYDSYYDYDRQEQYQGTPWGVIIFIFFAVLFIGSFFLRAKDNSATETDVTKSEIRRYDNSNVIKRSRAVNNMESNVEKSYSNAGNSNYPAYQYEFDEYDNSSSPTRSDYQEIIYTVKMGFFLNPENVDVLVMKLTKAFPQHAIWTKNAKTDLDQEGQKVFIGNFPTKAAAKSFSNALKKQGFEEGMIVPLVVQ